MHYSADAWILGLVALGDLGLFVCLRRARGRRLRTERRRSARLMRCLDVAIRRMNAGRA